MGDKEEHCYLIITPAPVAGLALKITGTGFAVTADGKDKPGNIEALHDRPLHFIKFGDETKIEKRVGAYRTHNPCFWWRTIKTTDALNIEEKLGHHLELRYLKDKVRQPYGASEWYALIGDHWPDRLKELCKELDTMRNKAVWWTADFKNLKDLEDFFDDFFKPSS